MFSGRKNLVKKGFSEGGSVQLDILLKDGGMPVLNLFQDLYVSCLKVLVGMATKDKPLVRTNNSSSVNL